MAFAAAALGIASAASPCTIRADPDIPFSRDHFVLYGEVTGHSSVAVDRCRILYFEENVPCPPAWGVVIRILAPVQVPVPGVELVEYFPFGFGDSCESLPANQASIERKFPAGTRVKVVARPLDVNAPGERRFLLTSLGPITNGISVLPRGAPVKRLAAKKFDYVAYYRQLVAADEQWRSWEELPFEMWRDKQRLSRTRSERQALEEMLRMAAAGDFGVIADDEANSPIEKLAAQYLPTPAFREEFGRRLRDALYDFGRAVAGGNARSRQRAGTTRRSSRNARLRIASPRQIDGRRHASGAERNRQLGLAIGALGLPAGDRRMVRTHRRPRR
jgi:hypothetical protein